MIFSVESRRNIEKKYFDWLKNTKTGKKILKTGSRDKNYTHYLVILFNFLNNICKKTTTTTKKTKNSLSKKKLAYHLTLKTSIVKDLNKTRIFITLANQIFV